MKKIIKSGISILLCVVMLFGAAPLSGLTGALGEIADWVDSIKLSVSASAASTLAPTGQCGKNVYWTFSESTGLLTISGEGLMDNNEREIMSPFYNNSEIKSVVIGDGIERIGSYSFYNCCNLETVSISESVKDISIGAFYGCRNLTDVVIPDGVEYIQGIAFAGCKKIYQVTISQTVSFISADAFSGCWLMEISVSEGNTTYYSKDNCVIESSTNTLVIADNIIIPDGVENIGFKAFGDWIDLYSITIPKSVKSINSNAFTTEISEVYYWGLEEDWEKIIGGTDNPDLMYAEIHYYNECGENATWQLENGKLSITGSGILEKGWTWDSINEQFTSVEIGNGITAIDDCTFDECYNITNVIIPNSVENIGFRAFSLCRNLESINIPDSVKSIGDYAFDYCDKLLNLTLGNGLIIIGKGAFQDCHTLKEVIIPEGVKRIDNYAFRSCIGLLEIAIPSTVEYIGEAVFLCCASLSKITVAPNNAVYDSRNNCNAIIETNDDFLIQGCNNTIIPNGIKSIARFAFGYMLDLTSIIIPDNVIYIGDFAFEGCENLIDITIPDNVRGIGNSIVGGTAYYLEDNNWDNELLYIGNHLVDSGIWNERDVSIKEGTKTIAKKTFAYSYDLKSITISISVVDIGEDAFYGVNDIIYSQDWYDDVMNGQGSPWGAKAVDAYVEGNLYYYDSSKELLLGCSPDASGTVNIPDTVEEVGEKCFLGCDNIETLTFSSPVHFADTAVAGCDNLQSVVAPDNSDDFGIVYTKPVTGGISTASVSGSSISIEYDTGILFCKRNASGDYTVPSKITHICENAFANCKNVSVIIPDGVVLKRIGANAFLNSKDYNDSAKWLNNVLVIGNYIVASKAELSGIYTVASAIKGVADRAFAGCSGMTGFNCGSGTRFLGSGVFSGCSSSLKDNLTFSSTESLEYIGGDIFDAENEKDYVKETTYCNNALISVSPDVESFTIEDGTTIIAEGAFEGCTNLKSITIPDSIKKINKDTFKGCISLSSVTLNANINEIGDNAFADCMSLTEISIPASVKEIGHLAFYGCMGMRSFNVASGNEKYKSDDGILMSADGNTVIQYPAAKDGTEYSITSGKSVADLAFYRCRNLQKITLADNVTLGNRNPFASCTADFNNGKYVFGDAKKTILKSVSASVTGEFTVPYTVKEIGSDALRECTGMTAVDFSNAYYLKKIGDNAFYGCTGLTDIIVPNTVTDIGTSAFENCLNLKTVEFTADKNSDINTKLVSIGDYAFCNCPCNATDGSCNSDILSAEKLEIGKNAFNNVFCDSVKLDSRGLIYGFNSGLDSLNSLINIDDDNVTVSCNTKTIGTGSVVTVTNGSEKSSYYNVVIFGDVNGDGWYDGTDAMIVSCLANGMLTKEDVSEAVYTAADCNHDGEINNDDVELLQQAGVLLVDIDQTKSKEELLETSSAYVEYLNLIDQTVEEDSAEITDVAPTPETAKTLFDILKETVIKIINYIILNLSILKLR